MEVILFRHVGRMKAKPLRNRKKSFRLIDDPRRLAEIEIVANFTPTKMLDMMAGLVGHERIATNPVRKPTTVSIPMRADRFQLGVVPPPPCRTLALPPAGNTAAPKKVAKPANKHGAVVPSMPKSQYDGSILRCHLIPRPAGVKSVTTVFTLDRDYVLAREMRVRSMGARARYW